MSIEKNSLKQDIRELTQQDGWNTQDGRMLNLPAVLLRKLANSSHEPAIVTERISKCAEAFICKLIDGHSYESLSTSPNSEQAQSSELSE